MSLWDRLTNIVRANLNDMTKKSEDPEQSLNLYIDEATEQIREFRVEVNRFTAQRIEAEERLRQAEEAAARYRNEAKGALKDGRKDDAYQALEKEQHENERVAKYSAELERTKDAARQLQEQLRTLEDKLREAKERRDDLVYRGRMADAQKGATDAVKGFDELDPKQRFDKLERQIERREAQAEASYSVYASTETFARDEMTRQEKRRTIDDAMAKLQAEIDEESE